MKLYTEEQVRTMLDRARLHNQDDTEMFTNEYLLSEETPIELPSDRDIEIAANGNQEHYEGAMWLKYKYLTKTNSCV
ncbi:hypothetical protein UFOVP203_53 [uncultured Caudovirales phage]|uniref:Uncharacterized protein n=1 Tax=uncultured Caudovirales phage TaxID=2100421 RepID=A0A6J7WMR7_9CAUD|nr:hypothetical protein UFOVP203_53 [uncultured Caudovirales phage]